MCAYPLSFLISVPLFMFCTQYYMSLFSSCIIYVIVFSIVLSFSYFPVILGVLLYSRMDPLLSTQSSTEKTVMPLSTQSNTDTSVPLLPTQSSTEKIALPIPTQSSTEKTVRPLPTQSSTETLVMPSPPRAALRKLPCPSLPRVAAQCYALNVMPSHVILLKVIPRKSKALSPC